MVGVLFAEGLVHALKQIRTLKPGQDESDSMYRFSRGMLPHCHEQESEQEERDEL